MISVDAIGEGRGLTIGATLMPLAVSVMLVVPGMIRFDACLYNKMPSVLSGEVSD